MNIWSSCMSFTTSNFETVMTSTTLLYIFFFFSSRRRHTRCSRDWSSDVCSSDLEPVGCRGHGAVEWLARIGTGRTALRNGNPHPTRHLAYGGGIIHAQLLHEERENVPTRVAHETVEHPLARDDGEVAVGAPVKRTRGAEIGPGALELDVLPDDPYDVGGLADLLDHVVGDEAHARNSTSVTPWPPWFGGANPKRFTRGSAERTSCTNWRRAPVPLPWTTRR